MTSHRDCTHPTTPSARARCRKARAAQAADLAAFEVETKIYHDTYVAPYLAQEAAKKAFADLAEARGATEDQETRALNNADDTSVEEGFAEYSTRYWNIATLTLHDILNTDPLWDQAP